MESLQLVPKEGIRERKKRLTHERICDVASKLFVEQGYSNTTIDAIAALADISKPTFFNYFASKLAVLHEIIDIMDEQPRFERMHGAMGQLIESGIVRGDVRKDYPIELLIRILFGSYLYALLTWLSGQQHSLAENLEDTAIFLAESIAPRA